jgi:hypothetical protein
MFIYILYSIVYNNYIYEDLRSLGTLVVVVVGRRD